jgi:pimeloyl-ACP methyl ester carboxylesterase
MKTTESVQAGPFRYTRYSVQSQVLNREVQYGVLRFLGDDGAPAPAATTLYFLHGGNGDDRQTVDAGLPSLIPDDLLATLRARGLQIVLPFVGTSFLREHPSKRERSFSEFLKDELMPLAESGMSPAPGQRFIGGFSMGGKAALNFFLRNPSLFQGVGAHFPTLIDFDYSDSSQAKAFQERTGISQPYFDILIGGFKGEFESPAEFSRHDPIALLDEPGARSLFGKKIYFDVGSEDEFGLHEGASAFSRKLTRLDVPHAFEQVQGGKHDLAFLTDRFPKLMRYLFA